MGNIRGGTLGFHGTIGQPTAQVIDGSLKIDAGSSQYLGRTPGSASNRMYGLDLYGSKDLFLVLISLFFSNTMHLISII